MKIIFLGAPGVGKGTIGKLVSERKKYLHISTGDLLRNEIKNKTGLGLKLKELVEGGKFVSNELILELLLNEMKSKNNENIILDGYPRNLEQAKALEEKFEIDFVVNFALDEKEIVRRLTGRRHCSKCGRGFNINTIPPEKEGLCDSCQGELIQRDDDKEEVIYERLKIYEEQTKLLIGFYKEKGILKEVDASKDVEGEYKETIEVLGLNKVKEDNLNKI